MGLTRKRGYPVYINAFYLAVSTPLIVIKIRL